MIVFFLTTHYYYLMKQRSPLLDLLRIVAAFLVLIFHWSGNGGFYPLLNSPYSLDWIPSWLLALGKYGYLGVDIFFMLSGAVIANSALRRSARSFAIGRFNRLYPVYFLATFASILLIPHFTSNQNILEDTFGLTGLQFWTGGPSIVGAAWTLAFEIHFYFIIFLSIYITERKSSFTSTVLIRVLSGWTLLILISPSLNSDAFKFTVIQEFAPYFILGAVLSQFKNLDAIRRLFPLFLVDASLAWRVLYGRIDHGNSLLVSLFIMAVSVVVLIAGNFETRVISSKHFIKIISHLSLMTYPIYLFHETLGMTMISILATVFTAPIACALTLFVLILSSWAVVSFIEPLFARIMEKVLKLRS